jgi:tryptophan synthase alpha chain
VSLVSDAFARAKSENRAALVGYLPAGLAGPSAFAAMVRGGCDVIEIGLPYSDPLLDGPVIQAAVQRALEAGTHTRDVLACVESVAALGVPALVMTYWNPVERYGVAAFARDLAAAGGAGLITPDLIPEEAGDWLAAADAHDLDRVFLVAPSSTDERLRVVGSTSRGFVYAASTMGVTGTRDQVSSVAPGLVARMRAVTSLPVAVGLGVSNGAQAAEVASYADGVIVGSAFVRAAMDADTPAADAAVEALAADLAEGCRVRSAS